MAVDIVLADRRPWEDSAQDKAQPWVALGEVSSDQNEAQRGMQMSQKNCCDYTRLAHSTIEDEASEDLGLSAGTLRSNHHFPWVRSRAVLSFGYS
jgi:hypothetical protein